MFSCRNGEISEVNKKKATELNNQAVELRMNGELDKAINLYKKAYEIDESNLNVHFSILGIYIQKKEIKKAFDFLDKLSKEQKKTVYYYQTKGNLFEYDGKIDEAKENYKKAYELNEMVEIKNESDLNTLINYTMLETFAGHKEKAVNRINETLKLEWLTEANKDYLETFRNEFEFYQGDGALEFQNEKEFRICTKNIDSLKQILKENHINISGSSSPIGISEFGEIRVNEKFRSKIEKLELKECE